MTMEKTTVPTLKGTKNYQIDIMKLFLSVCVVLYHARSYAPAGSFARQVADKFGWWSVHLFFIISGFFMAANYFKNKDSITKTPGKDSMNYVWNKIKGIAPVYFATFGINFVVRYFLDLYNNPLADKFDSFISLATRSIPEIFTVQMIGMRPVGINSFTWYISAMFIAMLPLYYVMKKKPDFFFYVLTPLLSIGIFGFFYNSDNPFVDNNAFLTIVSGGIVRALCGLSFGAVSYLIYLQINERIKTKKQMIWLTVGEVILLGYSAIIWLQRSYDHRILFPWALLFPLILAIAYSRKSYLSKIFSFKIFSKCGIWSTYIYLNHHVARRIINDTKMLAGQHYLKRYAAMAVMTAISCLLCFIIIKIIEHIKNRKKANPTIL